MFKLKEGNSMLDTQSTECCLQGQDSMERKMQTQECLWSWAGAKEQGQSQGCYPSLRSTGRTSLEHSGETQACKSHSRSVRLCCGEGAAISHGSWARQTFLVPAGNQCVKASRPHSPCVSTGKEEQSTTCN